VDSRPLAVVRGEQYALIYQYEPIPPIWQALPADVWPSLVTFAGAFATLHARAVWIAALPDGVTLDYRWWHPEDRGSWWLHPTGPQGSSPATVARIRRFDRPHERDRYVYDATADEQGRPRDSRWQFAGVPAGELAAVILDYEAAIGRTAGYSPAHDALAVLLDLHHGDAGRLASDPGPVRPVDQAPRYCRALTADDEGAWVHVYDVNAAYLAAANTELGLGTPREMDAAVSAETKHGYLHVSSPAREQPISRAGWYHIASIRAVLAARDILPAALDWESDRYRYIEWPAYRAVLRGWAAHYWTARNRCATPEARAAIKSAYTAAIGRFAVPDKTWYRPHWRGAIIAEQARRRWTDAAKLTAAGVPPLLISTDTIAIVSDDPAWQTAPLEALRLVDTPGGYKHVSSHALTPGLAAELRRGDERLTKRSLEIG
jgi:hypothetical protein